MLTRNHLCQSRADATPISSPASPSRFYLRGAVNALPEALVVVSDSCPFCPTVLAGLTDLMKAGHLARLEVVNIEHHPDAVAALGVRTVPWVRLGPFELDGLRSPTELKLWAKRAGSKAGMAAYVAELLATGALDKLVDLCRRDAHYLDALPLLIGDVETDLHVRLGIGALFEELQGQPMLARLVDALGALTTAAEARTRGDACHYLALTGNRRAIPYIEPLLDDGDAMVREVAQEALASFGQTRR